MPTHEQNLLLGSLPSDTLARLATHLEISEVPMMGELYAPGDRIRRVYFPLDGVVSMTTTVSGSMAEVATVGREGFVGLPVFLGTRIATLRTFMQVGGSLSCMPAAEFSDFVQDDSAFRSMMFRYTEAMLRQVGQSVVCNQRHTLSQRTARWLLTTHDRVPGDEFHLTHEFLAAMLGVRRAGVTVAAGLLQDAGLIRYRRGEITVLDREGLERVSCECYRVVRESYAALLNERDLAVEESPIGSP